MFYSSLFFHRILLKDQSDLRLGFFEINGNQHYTDAKRGKLKKYYRERQIYLESLGWKIVNVHYSLVYKKDQILEILTENKLFAPVA